MSPCLSRNGCSTNKTQRVPELSAVGGVIGGIWGIILEKAVKEPWCCFGVCYGVAGGK
jgi:hypothetical protein